MMEQVYELPVLALRGLCILPGMVTSIKIMRKASIKAVELAMRQDQKLFVSCQKQIETEEPNIEDLYKCGVIATIKQIAKISDSAFHVLITGEKKARIVDEVKHKASDCLFCRAEEVEELAVPLDTLKEEAYCRILRELLDELNQVAHSLSDGKMAVLNGCKSLEMLVTEITCMIDFSFEKKQALLEAYDILARYELLVKYLEEETEICQIKRNLQEKVRENVEQNQKEYILREQQKAIREELGEDHSDTDKYLEKMNALHASDEVKTAIRKEIERFQTMPPQAAESSMLRSYIETLLSMPWDNASEDNEDLGNAKKILDEDHYGLEKVKERMLEFLAVRSLVKAKGNSPIICLVGPPGVGKTSIARSVAKALNKKYFRMSLGGVHDEAEIRGHRRTYIGAMPGRIAQGLKQTGTKNPLMLLDEIDKLGSDYKGDPSSALLEVLDSEQNVKFRDNYIEIPLDLSEVLFIATANNVQTIPEPLLDRMELIEVNSYTVNEKMHIAQEHLVKKQIRLNGLKKGQLSISKKALEDIIMGYTRESGVRSLERKIGEICRKAARQIVEKKSAKVRVSKKNLCDFLGKPIFVNEVGENKSEVGIVTGLAWTSVGGDTLEVEVNVMSGKGDISLTGQLGDVMKESAQTGLSYVRSIAERYNIDGKYFNEHDIHIHVPEGAVPKDGPSAGVTMATAMISAITEIPVKAHVAMTGEITLRGRVLPIGGLKEKILAAKQFGVKMVIVPEKNRRDVEEISTEITDGIQIVYAKTMDDVLSYALDAE